MMPPGRRPRTGAGRPSIAAALLGCALALAAAPASASAAVGPSRDGALSPRLAELAKPSVRVLPPGRQAKLLSLARSGPGSLLRRGNRVVVEVRFNHSAAAGTTDLRTAGAQVLNVSRRYQTVTVAAKPADLAAFSHAPGVAGVKEVLTPMLFATEPTCPSGIAVSEGDTQLHAAEARNEFGVDGSGVTVGILSDSFDKATQAADGSGPVATHAEEDVESGDLPGIKNTCLGAQLPVKVLQDFSPAEPGEEATDEGRAMTQIVHDLAPGAGLAFATAFPSEAAFAENIKKLAKPVLEGGAGAKVIADDVAYFEEPFFQDGPVADAINQVVSKGVDYFTAAGNDNLIEAGTGNEVGSWEAPEFRNSGSCPPALVARVGTANAASCMDFNPGPEVDNAFGITVEKEATLTVDLQWAEPWEGVGTDLDAFLLNSAKEPIVVGGLIVGSAEDNVSGSGRPFEFFQWENTTGESQRVQLAINRCEGTCNPVASPAGKPRLKFALLEDGGGISNIEYPTSKGGDIVGPTIFGHAGAESAVSVGAVRFNTTSKPEEYSSRGPVTHYFGPVEGASPAPKLPSPATLSKPDIVATDCGATTFFAFEVGGAWRFCGTSAAAPHTAAVAALMLQEDPSATPETIRAALWASAAPVGAFGACAAGAGLVDAVGAIQQLPSPGAGGEPKCTAPSSPPWKVIEQGGVTPPPIEVEEDVPVPNPPIPEPLIAPRMPETFIRGHPRRVVSTRWLKAKAVFRFGSNEAGVTFVCRIDSGAAHICPERLVRRFKVGRHVVRVAARNAVGQVDRTPAVFRFRVKRIG